MSFRESFELHAPVERVFEALLDPEKVNRWMQADAAEVDADSSRYSYGWRRGEAEVGPVRILELVPNRLLVHDWQWVGEPDASVRWELSPTESGTRKRLAHSKSSTITHALGWSDAMLGIRRLVEEGGHAPR